MAAVEVKIVAITKDDILPVLKPLNSGIFPVQYSPAFYRSMEQYCAKWPTINLLATVDGYGVVGSICCRVEEIRDDDDYAASQQQQQSTSNLDSASSVLKRSSPPAQCITAQPPEKRSLSPALGGGGAASSPSSSEQTPSPPSAKTHTVYIMTLGVLPAFRGKGVGSALLSSVIASVSSGAARPPPSEEPSSEECAAANCEDDYAKCRDISLHVHSSSVEAERFYTRPSLGFVVRSVAKGYYKRLDPPDALVLAKTLG